MNQKENENIKKAAQEVLLYYQFPLTGLAAAQNEEERVEDARVPGVMLVPETTRKHMEKRIEETDLGRKDDGPVQDLLNFTNKLLLD